MDRRLPFIAVAVVGLSLPLYGQQGPLWDGDQPPDGAGRSGPLSAELDSELLDGDGPLANIPHDGLVVKIPESEDLGAELIRERYPSGEVKVERYVIQDDAQNYLNHGPWKMWDEQHNLICQGPYRFNQPHGTWTRTYVRHDDADLLSVPPYSDFTLPYESTAQMIEGKLNGAWEMRDAQGRMIFSWEVLDGRRHGKSTWWYPNGNPMRELRYEDGVLHGNMQEWDQAGKLITDVRFEGGRKIELKKETYPNGQPRYEGTVMHPRLVLNRPDDWWHCRLAKYEQEGELEKHGAWTSWYENGQKKMQGTYRHDKPVGEFLWWHANGQKALVGQFDSAGKKIGEWIWWHPNGMKSIQGAYAAGTPQGGWTWWNESGKVAQRTAFDAGTRQEMIAGPSRSPASQRPSARQQPAQQPAQQPVQQSRRSSSSWLWPSRQ